MRWRRQATMNSRAARPGSMAQDAGEQILPLHAGEHQHHGGDAGQNQRGAEIGLLDDEEDENHGHDDRAEQGLLQSRILSSRECRNQARNRTRTGLAISEG